jgi:hypothetical protein
MSSINGIMNQIRTTSALIVNGTGDGGLAAAAICRVVNNPNMIIEFTQPHQVNFLTDAMKKWPDSKKVVGFVDLAVNNSGKDADEITKNRKLTVDLIKEIHNLGHKINFIADEHSKEAWLSVLEECNVDINSLAIQPQTRTTDIFSSSSIVKNVFEDYKFHASGGDEIAARIDDHTFALLKDGDLCDKDPQAGFQSKFGKIWNETTKSNQGDRNRRPHMVRILSTQTEPDEKIKGWMNEYPIMVENSKKILNINDSDWFEGFQLNGIRVYNAVMNGKFLLHDPTAIFNSTYPPKNDSYYEVITVLLNSPTEGKASIATNIEGFDLLAAVRSVQVEVSGDKFKANISMTDANKAIHAVHHANKARLATVLSEE